MRGAVWRQAYTIEVMDNLPSPVLIEPRDAVLSVTRSAICGTDLHPYRGEIQDFQIDTVMGHEFTGVIEEIGDGVKGLRPGDRVVASDIVACGACWYCRRGWHYQCTQVSLFGFGTVVGSYLPGGQAEFVRVPFADTVLSKIPETLTDEQALFIGDILTTGYSSAVEARIRPGDKVAVVGCGPVGQLATVCAYLLGADQVFGIDPEPRRCNGIRQFGGYPIQSDERLTECVMDLTHDRGADVVIEAVGSDAALQTALEIVRPKGTVSIVGAHHAEAMPFPSGLAFGRELTLTFSVGDPIRYRDQLVPLIESGRIDPTLVISHRLPLSDADYAYGMFDRREATKIVLVP